MSKENQNKTVIDIKPHHVIEDTSPKETNYTRDSIMIEFNNQKYRVKSIKYGNQRASEEILMEKLFSLTGLSSPRTRYAITQPSSDYKIASPYLPGFQDLGKFLISDAELFIESSNKPHFLSLKNKVMEIEEQCKAKGATTSTDKLKKRDLLFQIYEMMPSHVKREFEKLFLTSTWIGNWDMLNFDLYNSGFIVDTKHCTVKAAIVDFGNCGPAGFKGQYKDESIDQAHLPAKQQSTSQLDYDPKLSNLNKIREEDTDLFIVPKSLFPVASMPRNLPFAKLFRHNVRSQSEIADTQKSQRSLPNELSSSIEVAYRLSFIKDNVIDRVIDYWYLKAHHADSRTENISYQRPENLYNEKYSAQELKNIMKSRRDQIIELFTPEQIEHWCTYNRTKAYTAQHEVTQAIVENLNKSQWLQYTQKSTQNSTSQTRRP